MSFIFPSNGFPLFKLFVYVKVPGYVVMYWHSSDLCAKLTFETKPCNPLAGPVYSASIYFQFHFPSIHEWLWFRLFWHKISTRPSHIGRLWRLLQKKKKGRHSEWAVPLINGIMWHFITMCLWFLTDWHCLFFQRIKRQSKPSKPVVSRRHS